MGTFYLTLIQIVKPKKIKTMENVIENNKLIDKFMGGEFFKPDDANYEIVQFPKDVFYSFRSESFDPNLPFSVPVSCARFNVSWNWLMPVVEKIDQILPDDNLVTITYNRCLIEYFQEGITIEGLGNTRIEATYKAVVEFIKWYNSKQKL